LHIAASVGYFIEYIMMHGTINIKKLPKFAVKWTASPHNVPEVPV